PPTITCHRRMSSAKPSEPTPPPIKLDYVAALLSYLIPGLGQLTQGRVRKGLLFLVSLYALFFYGMYLGKWNNVYLPDYHSEEPPVTGLAWSVHRRFRFGGQFPTGRVGWPAVYQSSVYKPDAPKPPLEGFMRAPSLDEINQLQRDGDKTWDLGWVYTVIAG